MDESLTVYGNQDYVRAAIGTRFDDPRTYADILKADGDELPFTMRHKGTYRPKAKGLPYWVYYDPKLIPLEIENIWKKHWQVACRAEDIPNVGDRVSYDVGTLSFLIVRSGSSEFKAFFNSCRHRGRKLCSSMGSGDHIQCPFHGWTYALDGSLKWIAREEDFPGVTAKKFGLREVQCATWGGNVFINPDPKAPLLRNALGVMADHFTDFPVEDRYTALRIRKKVRINWKAAQEAFMEGYHVLVTHPSGMPMFGSCYTQIDLWDDGVAHVSRLITPAVTPDGWVRSKISPSIGLRLFCNAYGFREPPADRGLTHSDARAFAAQVQRERLHAESGIDHSNRSTSYLLDMVQWTMFPNFYPWWGEGLAWWYNFTPYEDDPDACVMEIRVTKPIPTNGPCPASARPVDIDFEEKGADYPETGVVGLIMDEDMDNMAQVQKGLKAARADSAHAVLGVYQEDRVRHFHELYARKMGLEQKVSNHGDD